MDDRNQNNIILSYINDYISVPINKKLEDLYKNDYKEYKVMFVKLCAILNFFACDINNIPGGCHD